MAREIRSKTGSARFACRCKSLRCKPHHRRVGASGNIDRRITVYTGAPSAEIGFVYVIATEGKTVKIGFTRCPIRRLSELSGEYGDLRLYRAYGFDAKTARRVEFEIHRELAPYALSKPEWYKINPKKAVDTINKAIKPRTVSAAWLYANVK